MDSDQNKVFVGGIPWETTEDSLRDYFTGFGEVLDVIIMKDRTTGRARGFGFVEFAKASVAEKVIQEKHTVDGRSVEAKKAFRRDEHQNHSRTSSSVGSPASASNTRTKKIFVGGLASTVTEEDFKKYFEQFGTIIDAVVMYDHTTQRPRGFGFITFDSEDAVERALQKSLHELHDKTVEVKKAVPKDLSSGRQGFGPGRGAAGYGYSSSASASPGYGGPHYTPPPGARGFFPPYGPPPFGSPGYGPPGMGYGVAMNGGFGGPMYGGPGYPSGPYAVGYGAGPTAGYVGLPGGYGTMGAPPSPAGVRSPWGGSGYAGSMSPAYSGGANVYGKASWRPGSGAGPATNMVTGYNSVSYNSGMNDNTMNSTAARNATGASSSYGDAYAASVPYGSTESRGSPATPSPLSSGDPAGYGVAGRQSQRGPDARFRPYPASVDRVP